MDNKNNQERDEPKPLSPGEIKQLIEEAKTKKCVVEVVDFLEDSVFLERFIEEYGYEISTIMLDK